MSINEYDDMLKRQKPASGQGNQYFDQLSDVKAQDSSEIQMNMYAAKDAQPDMQKKILDLSKQTKLPADFIERNFDEVSKAQKVKGRDYNEIANNSPAVSNFLKDPQNAKLAKDDIDGLIVIDGKLQSVAKMNEKKEPNYFGELGHAADTGFDTMVGGFYAVAQAYGVVDSDTAAEAMAEYNQKAMAAREQFPTYAKEFTDIMTKEGADVDKTFKAFWNNLQRAMYAPPDEQTGEAMTRQQRLGEVYSAYMNGAYTVGEFLDLTQEVLRRPKGLGHFAAEQIGNMVPAFAGAGLGLKAGAATAPLTGPVGPVVGAGAGGFFGQLPVEIGAWINQELAQRGFDTSNPDDLRKAFSDATLMKEIREQGERKGVTTALVGSLFSVIGGRIAARSAQTVAGKVGSKVAGAGVDVVGEGIGEGAGQLAAYEGDVSKVDMGEVIAEMFGAVGSAPVTTAISAAAWAKRKALSKDPEKATQEIIKQKDDALKTLQVADVIQNVGEEINKLQHVKDVPDKIKELIDGGKTGSVFFQTDEWDNYWLSKGISPIQKADEILGERVTLYHEAKKNGTALELSMGEFISSTATTGDLQALLGVTRVLPDGPTVKNARDTIKELPAMIEGLAKEMAASSEKVTTIDEQMQKELSEIRQGVEDQLKALGRDAKIVKNEAKVFESILRTLAERTGQTPKQLFEKFGLRVMGKQEGLAGQQFGQVVYDSENEQVKIKTDDVNASGTFGTEESISDFVNPEGAGYKKISLKKAGLDKFERPFMFEYLEVPSEKRGQGIAKKAIKQIEAEAARQGADVVLLNASPMGVADKASSLDRLIKLYEGEGYKVIRKSEGNAEMFKPIDRTLYQTQPNELGYFSAIETLIADKMPARADATLIRGLIKNLKPDEIKWSGIDDFLKTKDKFTKEEVLEFLRANQLQIKEVVLGGEVTTEARRQLRLEQANRAVIEQAKSQGIGDPNDYALTIANDDLSASQRELMSAEMRPLAKELREAFVARERGDYEAAENERTKFSQYTLPGGENYREVRLTMPPKPLTDLPDGYYQTEGSNGDVQIRDKDGRIAGFGPTKEEALADFQKVNFKSDTFRSSHWTDVDNVLAHVRLDDRVDSDGKKVLFVNEIQSDWHQEGRDKGYGEPFVKPEKTFSDAEVKRIKEEFAEKVDAVEKEVQQFSLEQRDALYKQMNDNPPDLKRMIGTIGLGIQEAYNRGVITIEDLRTMEAVNSQQFREPIRTGQVPDAPFKKTDQWITFALKRIIRMAAEGKYDRVGFVRGEQAAEFFDLSKQISEVHYSGSNLTAYDHSGNKVVERTGVQESELADYIGKDAAEKLLAQPMEKTKYRVSNGNSDFDLVVSSKEKAKEQAAWLKKQKLEGRTKVTITEEKTKGTLRSLTGVDLKVGGEGMKTFYDKIVVNAANGFIKKFGSKVGETDISSGIGRKVPIDQYDIIQSEDTAEYQLIDTMDADNIIDSFETMQEAEDAKDKLIDEQSGGKNFTVHSFDLTEQLKNTALEQGFSLFQKDQGRITFGPDGKSIIEIFNNKNPSTFIHEIGHYYLEMIGALAEAEDAPQQIKDDFARALKWLGVEKREDIKTEQHEQWARGFEAYLMEGKAPSLALRDVFYRFKTWLISTYKNIRSLNVELSPEMRDVFGRMLATDQEILEATGELAMDSVDASTFGMTGEKAEKFMQAKEDAIRAAEEKLGAEIMEGYLRTQRKEWKDNKKKIKAEVEKEANEMPVYRAMSILQFNKNPDGTPLPESFSGMKLDRQALVQEFGADFVKALPKPFVYSREGGLHHDLAAESLGFESGEAMVNEISRALPRKDYIEAETERRMQLEYPDLVTMDAVTMADHAMQAVHTDKRGQMLRLALDHMWEHNKGITKETIRRSIQRMPPDNVVKAEARAMIGKRAVRELKPHLYLAAEKRAAKGAAQAWTAGEFDLAYQEKYRELLNHELYRAAQEAKQDVKKRTDRLKKVFRKDEDIAKTREINYVLAARAILADYGLGQKDKSTMSYLAPLRTYDEDAYLSAAVQIEGLSDIKPVDDFKKLTLDEFMRVSEVVTSLWDLSKQAKEIEKDGKKIALDEAKEKLIAQMQQFVKPENKQQYDEDADKWDKTKTSLLGVKSMLRRFEHWISGMDLDVKGPFREYLFESISEASDQYTLKAKEYKQKLTKEAEKIRPTMTYDKIEAPEIGFRFQNKGQVIAALLHIGNDSNKKKLLVGRNWGTLREDGTLDDTKWNKFLDRAFREGIITKVDMDFVQSVWDTNEEIKPLAQKAHKKLFGFYFNEVTHNEFETPFGKYRGGYMPAMIESEPPKKGPARAYGIGDKQKLEEITNKVTSYTWPASGGKGFTKTRVENFNKPLSLDITRINQHINAVLKFAIVKPAVVDAAKIVVSHDFREAMAAIDPTVINEMILPALNRADKQQIATIEGKGPAFIGRFANYLRTSASMQIMFANVQNILEQPSSMSAALLRVDAKHMARATAQFFKSPRVVAKDIAAKSSFMNIRFDDQIFEIDKVFRDIFEEVNALEKMQDWSRKHMYFGQIFTQNIMDAIVWSAAYDQAVLNGESETSAVRLADSVVRETQGSIRPMDISVAEANPMLRIFQMFMGFFNNVANLNATEMKKIYYSDMGIKEKTGRGLYVYSMGFAFMAVFSAALKKALSGKGLDQDEDGEVIDDIIEVVFDSQVRFLTAMAPVAGTAIQSGLNRVNKNPMDDRVSASPAITTLSTVVGAPISIAKAKIEGDDLKKRDVKDAFTAMGIVLGLPIGPMSRPITYIKDVSEGETQPTGPIDFVRGLTTGQ